ncbi:MAG: hypothetical protein ACOYNC_13750 [Bacteroidales bacterium]
MGLKILISHGSLYKRAGWGRTFPLAVGLTKLGNRVTIITTSPNYSIFIKKMTTDGVNIIIFPEIIPARISRLGFGFLSLILKVLYVIFNKSDIVHSDNGHRPLSGIPCRIHKKLYDSVYIAEWYDWFGQGGQYDSKKKIFKIFLGRYELKYEIKDKMVADGVVVLSEVLKQRMLSLDSRKIIIKLHGGADVNSIPFLSDNKILKEKFGIKKEMVTFGYIDAFNRTLNEIQPLVDAIYELGIESRVKLLLFGRTNSLVDSLPGKVKEISINFGWVNYAEDYEKLQCVDVFFTFKENHLGNKAGWPNCIGDYLACGRPIFLNPIGEVVEFVNKHPKGFFISELSHHSITKELGYIMQHPSDFIEMGATNRSISENEISWERKSEILFDFYKKILISKSIQCSDN